MARVGKDDYGQGAQRLDRAGPLNDTNILGAGVRIGGKVVDDEDDEVANGDEGDDAGVLEGVEAAQEAQRDDEEHKGGDPKVAAEEVGELGGVAGDALHDAGHQVADDDHVGDADAEALDGDGGVKDDGGVGVGDLREGEEGGGAAVEVSGASGLEVEAKGGGDAGPEDEDDAEHDAHAGEDKGHR